MQPRKTELAHTVLQTHRAALDLRRRRALILCDGHRNLAELSALLGGDATLMIQQLQRDGYLQREPDPPASTDATARPASGQRRSLVAARLYVLDLLVLQRHPVAVQLHGLLQATREGSDIAHALRQVLTQLPALNSPGYVQRVRERLREVLPEAQLSAVLEEPALPA